MRLARFQAAKLRGRESVGDGTDGCCELGLTGTAWYALVSGAGSSQLPLFEGDNVKQWLPSVVLPTDGRFT